MYNRCRRCENLTDFLLVHHSNVGTILYRFSDSAVFLLMTTPLFHINLGRGGFGVPVGPDHPCNVGVSPRIGLNLKLVSREIIFEVIQPM